ncbi:MAG: hypothetical protein SynsKO_40320 [Synoicihabitans sp.]
MRGGRSPDNTMKFRFPLLVVALISLAIASVTGANDERPKNAPAVEIVSRDAIYSIDDQVTSPNNQVHFPFMFEAADGKWYMTLREGPHVWGPNNTGLPLDNESRSLFASDRVQTVYSPDQGESWRPWAGLKAEDTWLRFFRTQLPDGSMVSPGYRFREWEPDPDGGIVVSLTLRFSHDGGATWEKQSREIRRMPFAQPVKTITAVTWGHVLPVTSERLLLAVYGRPPESIDARWGYGMGVLASDDGGDHWRFESWISRGDDVGSEGPSETDLVHFGDGRLMAIFRTGTRGSDGAVDRPVPSALHVAHSADGGKTWTPPTATPFAGGVSPQLLRLRSGLLVLSYGARTEDGDSVRVHTSADEGRTWSDALVLYVGPGSGYTDMTELADGRFQIVYDESRFYRWDPEMDRNEVIRVILQERR